MSNTPIYREIGVQDVDFGRNVTVIKPANLYGCKIGDDSFIGHGVMFINDWFRTGRPARGHPELWVPTVIGNRVSIGSNATVLPVKICDDVAIGAGAVVTADIDKPGIYLGSPARFVRPFDPPPAGGS